MPRRGPKGIVARPVADWLISGMMGGGDTSAGVAGQIVYIELFNNATDGSYLWVYFIWVYETGSDSIPIEFYVGRKASTSGSQGPLQCDQPIGPGLTGHFSSAVQVGTRIGLLSGNNQATSWFMQSPIAKIPPGYSVGVRNGTVSTGMNVGFWWLPLQN